MSNSILVYDHGWFVSLACRLTRDFDRVGYFRPWQDGAMPDGHELVVGYGLPGVERIKNFWASLHEFDYIVFPDVWNSELQVELRRMGHRVWGSGKGADLELLRWTTHELLEKVGLPRNNAVRLRGFDRLEQYLSEHENVWVKLSTLRGLDETWFSRNLEYSEEKLADIKSRYGGLRSLLDFIVEDDIPDANEIGYDGICVDGQFPTTAVVGVEKKDRSYACEVVPYGELPDEVRAVNDKLSPVLKRDEYRNWFSTEIRNDMLIDVTARHASPAGETYCELVNNLGNVIMAGADGRLVEPEITDRYGAQILLASEWAEKHWLAVKFPEEIRQFVKLYNHCRIDGVDYVVPQGLKQMREIGSVVATAPTMEEAQKLCRERVKQVEAMKLESFDDSLEEAIEEVESL